RRLLSNRIGAFERAPTDERRLAIAHAQLIENSRRQRGHQRCGVYTRYLIDEAIVAIRPNGNADSGAGRPTLFDGPAEEEFFRLVEVVIDAEIVRIAIAVRPRSIGNVVSFHPALPKDACGIQTVADPVIVRRRHPAKYLLNPSTRIDCRP